MLKVALEFGGDPADVPRLLPEETGEHLGLFVDLGRHDRARGGAGHRT